VYSVDKNAITITTLSATDTITKSSSATAFFSIYVIMVFIGIFTFLFWDRSEISVFKLNKDVADKMKIAPPRFSLDDAFKTRGVTEVSLVSFTDKQKSQKLASQRGEFDIIGSMDETTTPPSATFLERIFSPASLLMHDNIGVRTIQALLRNHSFLRIFSYSSLRVTRMLRFLVFVTDMLLILFVDTVFYQTAYPRNNRCYEHSYVSRESCLYRDAHFEEGKHLCYWNEEASLCSLRNPEGNFRFYLIVCLVILAIIIVPQSAVKWLYEYVYSKQVSLSLAALTPNPSAAETVTSPPVADESGGASPPLDTAKDGDESSKILVQLSRHADCDHHIKNKVLVQHFILEQMNALDRFFLSLHFFTDDSASPEDISLIVWLLTLICTVGVWLYFVIWIFLWTTTNEESLVYSWGVTFIFTWLVECFLFQPISAFLIYVLPIDLIRVRLHAVHRVLGGAFGQAAQQLPPVTETTEEQAIQALRADTRPPAPVPVPAPLPTPTDPEGGGDSRPSSAAIRASMRLSGTNNLRAAELLRRVDEKITARPGSPPPPTKPAHPALPIQPLGSLGPLPPPPTSQSSPSAVEKFSEPVQTPEEKTTEPVGAPVSDVPEQVLAKPAAAASGSSDQPFGKGEASII